MEEGVKKGNDEEDEKRVQKLLTDVKAEFFNAVEDNDQIKAGKIIGLIRMIYDGQFSEFQSDLDAPSLILVQFLDHIGLQHLSEKVNKGSYDHDFAPRERER